jgi:3-deoxy-manno-octulosonate cytidylyltransferase (CMP-KDO synthetase)
LSKENFVINLQGDEPEMSPENLIAFADFLTSENPLVATAYTQHEIPGSVRAAVSCGRVLYFSRILLPGSFSHVGLYGYKVRFLEDFMFPSKTPLAAAENLEQLAFLEKGYVVQGYEVDHKYKGIDTLSDYEEFARREESRACSQDGDTGRSVK